MIYKKNNFKCYNEGQSRLGRFEEREKKLNLVESLVKSTEIGLNIQKVGI